MDQLLARETLNASWSILTLALALVFAMRVFSLIRKVGFYNDEGNRTAIACGGYFAAEFGYRLWIFGLLWGIHTDDGYLGENYWFAFVCGGIALACGLCLIRLFSRDSWGNWGWFLIYLIVMGVGAWVADYGWRYAPR